MRDSQLIKHFQQHQQSLLDSLYQIINNPTNWSSFLHELVAATDSRSSRLLVLNDKANKVLHSTKVNTDESHHQRYVDYYVNTCPWRSELSQKPQGQLYSTYLDFSCKQDAFYKTEFFNDWAKQQDIHHGICGTVFTQDDYKVQLLVQRTLGHGHYTRHATDLVNGILPHLRQVLRMGKQQAEQQILTKATINAAEARSLPFALMDATGRVTYLSPRSENLFQHDLTLQDNHIKCTEYAVQQRFNAALQRVIAHSQDLISHEEVLHIRRHGRSTLRCLFSPIYAGAQGLFDVHRSTYVALYIQDEECPAHINTQLLMELFSLSESEARVAAYIAQGLDPQAIAERDNRSMHTIRSHLKAVFTKTRCNRQNQLTALILQSPAATNV